MTDTKKKGEAFNRAIAEVFYKHDMMKADLAYYEFTRAAGERRSRLLGAEAKRSSNRAAERTLTARSASEINLKISKDPKGRVYHVTSPDLPELFVSYGNPATALTLALQTLDAICKCKGQDNPLSKGPDDV